MSSGRVRLLDEGEEPDWDALEDGAWARAFLGPMLRDGIAPYVANVRQTALRLIVVDERTVLPLTINDATLRDPPNAWVVSPRNAYVDYAGEELHELDGAALRTSLRGALAGLGAVLAAGRVDRIVHVDNWCLSTNLHPELDVDVLREVQSLLRDTWPDHAHAWRSVHAWRGEALPERLRALGYTPVPARSCFVWDPHDPSHRRSRDLKHDARLLRNRGFEIVDADGLSSEDAPRLRALYDALYLDKYSRHNPWFTDAFVRAALDGALTVKALRRDGELYGVVGFFRRAGFMTTPLFGYDTELPMKEGLYRMCSRLLVDAALDSGDILHQSAGAASFKRNRHAEPVLEETLVDVGHLGMSRRAAWGVLRQGLEKIAVPLVEKAGL